MCLGTMARMASLKEKIDAELKIRGLLDEGGLPQPDRVEYGYTCIRLFWDDTKSVVVVDIDEPGESAERRRARHGGGELNRADSELP
jgi:hypothetical protein